MRQNYNKFRLGRNLSLQKVIGQFYKKYIVEILKMGRFLTKEILDLK